MSGDFLIQAVITLLIAIAGGTRGSCSGSVWFTWPMGWRNLEMDVFLVVPCQKAAWGSHCKRPLCATPAKPSVPWDPCVWSSATASVKMSIFQPSREQEAREMWQHFCPAREPLTWAIQPSPSLPDQRDPGTGQEFVVTPCLRPCFYFGKLSMSPFWACKSELSNKVL